MSFFICYILFIICFFVLYFLFHLSLKINSPLQFFIDKTTLNKLHYFLWLILFHKNVDKMKILNSHKN